MATVTDERVLELSYPPARVFARGNSTLLQAATAGRGPSAGPRWSPSCADGGCIPSLLRTASQAERISTMAPSCVSYLRVSAYLSDRRSRVGRSLALRVRKELEATLPRSTAGGQARLATPVPVEQLAELRAPSVQQGACRKPSRRLDPASACARSGSRRGSATRAPKWSLVRLGPKTQRSSSVP